MKQIENINGLAESYDRLGGRTVHYRGEACPLVSRREVLCEQDTSFRGDVMSSTEIYQTPVGLVERSYKAWGAALERRNTKWRLVAVEEIAAAQARFIAASAEMAEAEAELRALVPAVDAAPVPA